MTTTMNVRKSEVFRVHQQLFQIPFQLRDWLSQVCKTIFLCNLQLSPVKWMNMRLWSVLSFHFFLATPPLPFSAGFLLLLVCLLVSTGPRQYFPMCALQIVNHDPAAFSIIIKIYCCWSIWFIRHMWMNSLFIRISIFLDLFTSKPVLGLRIWKIANRLRRFFD